MHTLSKSSMASGLRLTLPTVAVPITLLFSGNEKKGESEASGSTYVTPQQQRRKNPSAQPHHSQHPHRRNRKVSAPPELQPHLGSNHHHVSHHQKDGGANLEHGEASNPGELVFTINANNKLALPEGLRSGTDSGVQSEYSWAAPVGNHSVFEHSNNYEDVHPRSISGSLEDFRIVGLHQGEGYGSDTDEEKMAQHPSPHVTHRPGGLTNPGFVHSEIQQHQQPLAYTANGGPPPLNRANTDGNLLGGGNNLVPNQQQRSRTNSMVFQLNLPNAVTQGQSNTLPNQHSARSVSMISLNNAGQNQGNIPIQYPNLHGFQNDNYSDAGAPHYQAGSFLGTNLSSHLGSHMGSQGSLGGVGYSSMANKGGHQNNPPEEYEDPPMTDEEKAKWTSDNLATNLSTMYAILLFMIGTVLYLADTFSGKHKVAFGEILNVYLIVVQLLWLGYIHIDVRQYINTISMAMEEARQKNGKDQTQIGQTVEMIDGQYQITINLPEKRKSYPQYYGFTSGRHGGSLYLKMGAAVFCLGYLIHTGLNLGQKILFMIEDDPKFASCTCAQDILMSVLQPIYAFYQLFFIFKYSNLIINRRKRLSKFALMHCISASLLFWVYTIIQETLQAISSKHADKDGSDYLNATSTTTTTPFPSYKSSVLGEDSEEDEDDDDDYGTSIFDKSYGYGRKELTINYGCGMTTELTKMINSTTPYLYPFSIEYNILIVGIWILLWENIGRVDRHTHLPSVEVQYEDEDNVGIMSNFIIYVDCHSSNRGLFAGLLLTVGTIISIILFFIFTINKSTLNIGLELNGYSELIVLAIMTIVVVLSYMSTKKLDILKHSVSQVDDILLYICIPFIFLFAVFSMVPAITADKPLFVAVSIAQVIQAVLQTAIIVDGLRRCSNSNVLYSKKPGRELITFLVVANLALWLLETFEIKSYDGNQYKYKYYGKEAWTLLSHMTLPLALFYRFHSSVCLVDIWKTGYEPEAEH